MKMLVSLLLASTTLVLAGCGADAPTPIPAPAPAATCAKPRGNYLFSASITQVSSDARCDGTVGDRGDVPLQFDVAGNVVSVLKSAGVTCTTAYSDHDCTLTASCFGSFDDGTISEKYLYTLSEDGLVLRGSWTTTGTGAYCPRVVFEGIAGYTG